MKQKRQSLLFLVILAGGAMLMGAAMLTGCMVRGSASMHSQPQLVSVGSGLWVVEDYHEPVFYNDGFYWRYYGNTWYRSRVHNSGWIIVQNHSVPRLVVSIDRPTTYVHYRARPGARVRRGTPHKGHRPAARPHQRGDSSRSKAQHQGRDQRTNQRPRGQDHRDKSSKKRANH